MRKINYKLLLGLLLGVLLTTGAVFGIHRFQYDRIADSLLWQARRAEEQGQVKKQARYLQRYLEFHPKDLEQKTRLAQLWAGESFADAPKLRRRAVYLLDDVLTYSEDRPELRRLLVKLALEVKLLKVARDHLEKLLSRAFLDSPPSVNAASEQAPDPMRGEAAGYAGQLLQAENQWLKARSCYTLALHHAPKAENNYLHLALLLRQQEQPDPTQTRANQREADRTIDRMVEKNPQSPEALLARWNYRREFGLIVLHEEQGNQYVSIAEAARDVEKALQLAPESMEALLAAADLERLQARAVAVSRASDQEKDKNRRKHRDKALTYLEQGLALHAKSDRPPGIDTMGFRFLWHKANLLLDDREWREAAESEISGRDSDRGSDWTADVRRVLEQLRATNGSRSAIEFLQGRLLLLQHRWNEAAMLLEQVRPALTTQRELSAQINRCLGKAYEQLGEAGPMFEAFQRLNESEPQSPTAQIGMGQAEWMMGHLDKASDRYRRLYAGGQMPRKLFLDFARLEIQRQSQERRPDWTTVEKFVDAAAKQNPHAVEIPLLRAQLCLARDGKTEEANDLLRKAQDEPGGKERVEFWIARIQLELLGKDKNVKKARALLADAKKQLGDRVMALRLAEARLLAEEKAKGAEEPINRLADDLEQFSSEDDKARLLAGLADIQMSLDNLTSARRLWQRVAELPSKQTDLPLHLLLFDLASKAGDEEGIRQALDAIHALEGEKGPFHLYGEALRLIAQARQQEGEVRLKTLEEASSRLEHVRGIRPNWPALFLARAQIERLAGRDDGAIRYLRLAKENDAGGMLVVRELVELLVKAGRYDEADAELRSLRGTLLVHSDLGRIATTLAAQLKDTERTRKLLELNRSDDSGRDYRQLVWEGRMLDQSDQHKEAEAKWRAAQKAAPQQPEPYVALVQFLVRQKREKEAEPILEQARRHLPAAEVDLTLGHCYDLLGQKPKAQEHYEAALQSHRQNAAVVRRVAGFYWNSSQLAATESLLREIMNKRVRNASSDDVNWARWHLALVLTASGDARRFREALTLVGLRLDDKGQVIRDSTRQRLDSSDKRRFQARVLASQAGNRSFRAYAIELLEELERNQALPPEDRFILATLFEADNAWDKAKPILKELAYQKEPLPLHLASYVQMLLEHRELSAAAKELERLQALENRSGAEPNAFAAVELQARLLEEQHQGGKAIKLLEDHIQRKNAHPDEVLLVLNSLQRQKKFAQAYERCLKAWKANGCTPEVIGGAAVAIFRAMQSTEPLTPEQVAVIEKHLNEALSAHPKNVLLMLHLADLYDQRGRWQEAETMYRRVLQPENDPKNIVALNNLSWLLAQRSTDPTKHQEALGHIEEALEEIGRRADLLDTRGLVRMKLGQDAAALADFRDASTDMPTPAHLFHLARAHYKVKDKSNARKAFKLAQEQGLEAGVLHPSEQSEYLKLQMDLLP